MRQDWYLKQLELCNDSFHTDWEVCGFISPIPEGTFAAVERLDTKDVLSSIETQVWIFCVLSATS
jgi:hypothetical protein